MAGVEGTEASTRTFLQVGVGGPAGLFRSKARRRRRQPEVIQLQGWGRGQLCGDRGGGEQSEARGARRRG